METKVCSKCRQEFPATTEYFGKDKHQLCGLTGQCKACRCANTQKWRDKNPEKVKDYNKQYYDEHRDQELARNKDWHRKNPDKWKKRRSHWYITHVDYARQWRRNYYRNHIAETRDYDRRRYIRDGERIRAYSKLWRQKFPEKITLIQQRRVTRQIGLPNTLTEQEWQHATQYWQGKCAYCLESFNEDNHKLTLDHYIPVSRIDCPGTTANNCIPACSTCNASKGPKEATEWMIWRFGDELATLRHNTLRAYFNSLK